MIQVLGRATELNSFVKIGTEEGHIEIELKGAKGKPNLVIRRTLSAKSKANQFTINGRSASGKDINSRMQELNVQVSNLWFVHPSISYGPSVNVPQLFLASR